MADPIDWSGIVTFAQEMIATYGRDINISKYASGPTDPDRRWRGAGVPTLADSVSSKGAFVPATGSEFGRSIANDDMLANVEQIILVGQTSPDTEKYTHIEDGPVTYKIEWAWILKPGPTIVLYAFGVCR